MSYSVMDFKELNKRFLNRLFEEIEEHHSHSSLISTTIIKANVRRMMYELKIIQKQTSMSEDEMLELQLQIAKIIVSLMHNYLGSMNSSPFIDHMFFNIFYGNFTFDVEPYFEIFSDFAANTSKKNNDYTQVFSEIVPFKKTEHLPDDSFFKTIKKVLYENSSSLAPFLLGLTQLYYIFKRLHDKSVEEAYIKRRNTEDLENFADQILGLFESEITKLSDAKNREILLQLLKFLSFENFLSLYESADATDLTDDVIYLEKVNPETREGIRILDILAGMERTPQRDTYILAWADLIIRDDSTQRLKVQAEYGPILDNNPEAVAALKTFGGLFGGDDPLAKHRADSYAYIGEDESPILDEYNDLNVIDRYLRKNNDLSHNELTQKAIELVQAMNASFTEFLENHHDLDVDSDFFVAFIQFLIMSILVSDEMVDEKEYRIYSDIIEFIGETPHSLEVLQSLRDENVLDLQAQIQTTQIFLKHEMIDKNDLVEFLVILSLINGEFAIFERAFIENILDMSPSDSSQ